MDVLHPVKVYEQVPFLSFNLKFLIELKLFCIADDSVPGKAYLRLFLHPKKKKSRMSTSEQHRDSWDIGCKHSCLCFVTALSSLALSLCLFWFQRHTQLLAASTLRWLPVLFTAAALLQGNAQISLFVKCSNKGK